MALNKEYFKDKKVIIAGGTGFIGREVVKQLVELKAECMVITRQNISNEDDVKYACCDLNDLETYNFEKVFGKTEYDIGIYMAANIPTIGMKKESYLDSKKSTLDPFLHFCDIFVPKIKKLIYISSVDVLGAVEAVHYNEDQQPNKPTPYGLAKYCGELYVEQMCRVNDVSLSILRFTQVYGKNEPFIRIIPILIDAVKNNKPFTLFTTGEEKRSFLYIKDAVSAILCACSHKDTVGIYNISGLGENSINELIDIITKVIDKPINLIRKNTVQGVNNIPDITKANNILEYHPQFRLEAGITEIIKER